MASYLLSLLCLLISNLKKNEEEGTSQPQYQAFPAYE